ncbi:MAG: Gfo/Idh/MocA family oxidoreductase, partial [Alphaproteobacteria bacterium]|nr:Gfo/Idh/MocA family oxidoreductase [Alphaproteobacteria bacterium]
MPPSRRSSATCRPTSSRRSRPQRRRVCTGLTTVERPIRRGGEAHEGSCLAASAGAGADRRDALLERLASIADACDLSIPPTHRRTIGVVGAGAIVDVAHLPAYRKADLHVAGIHDRDVARARRVAAGHQVAHVYETLDDLLADPAVDVVDIAIHPAHQPEIAIRALEAGKDVICQKPLALDLASAQAIADRAADLHRKAAVQQQLRYEEGIAAARAMLREGWIGEPTTISFTVDIQTDFRAWSWLMAADKLDLFYHSIHYLDAIRSLLGEPVRVFGTQSRRRGQLPLGETRTISTLVYPGEVRAVVHTNHENVTGQNRAEFQIDGTEGTIRGTLGLLYDYPNGRPSTLEVWSRILPTDHWLSYPVTTR